MTVKTDVSRFQIHDELTSPEESALLLKSILAAGRSIGKFVGVLAGAPTVLRAYTRMNRELRNSKLAMPTRERIALGVAEHRGDAYSVAQHALTARVSGLGLDEISKARSFDSSDEKEAALLHFLHAVLEADGHPPHYLHEEAREAGWDDEELLEAIGWLALSEFQSLIATAAALPKDQATPRVLPDAA
ncbi:MAG TPA: carboxymuconolactone decarboxylase family protein [Solirubrobacterales bacterium]|nr:carboxymuconolactone decarboxylase family protein [Solirubrobacterales bacterium]